MAVVWPGLGPGFRWGTLQRCPMQAAMGEWRRRDGREGEEKKGEKRVAGKGRGEEGGEEKEGEERRNGPLRFFGQVYAPEMW